MPDFKMQSNAFPIASVIDAASKNAQLQQQTRDEGNRSLVEGLKAIGGVGQSLYDMKWRMAQALAASKMYAQTPEGQQMLAPTTTSTTTQAPVMRSQTAAYDPGTGSVTPNGPPAIGPAMPNAGMTGVGTTVPQTKTTTTPAPVNMGDLQTAMYGESPSNMLTQLFERQKQRQQFGLEQQKQAFTEKIEPQKLAQQAALTTALTGVKSKQVGVEQENNIRNQIATLEARKAAAITKFPELSGTFISGLLPKGSNAQETAAFQDYNDAQKQIEGYNRQLYGGSTSGGGKGKVGITMQTQNGVSYTVTPTP